MAIRRLARDILTPITYGRIAYLLIALPLGIVWFTFLVTAIAVGLGTAITLIGIPILIGTMYAWRWVAKLERRLIASLTGVQIEDPYRPEPEGAGWSRRISTRLGDPATWKDLVFLLLQLPLGIASLHGRRRRARAGAVLDRGARLVLVDTRRDRARDRDRRHARRGAPARAARARGRVRSASRRSVSSGACYGALATLLLGSNPDPELTAQVTELEGARSRIIAAADAERRRIERDLHDGAQQRLVALSLTLRMAESRAEKGDPEAADLIRNAGEEAGLALKDLRDLARGIHPAILTNRGLAAALDDLAARATVPVEVTDAPPERLPDQVEAAAYFVVSECLANVGQACAGVRRQRVGPDRGRPARASRWRTTARAAPTPRTARASRACATASGRSAAGSRSRARRRAARACARRSRWRCPRISTSSRRRGAPSRPR